MIAHGTSPESRSQPNSFGLGVRGAMSLRISLFARATYHLHPFLNRKIGELLPLCRGAFPVQAFGTPPARDHSKTLNRWPRSFLHGLAPRRDRHITES